jgi:hypothetical protein
MGLNNTAYFHAPFLDMRFNNFFTCGNLAQGNGLVTTLATLIAVADARTKASLSYAPLGQ